MDKSHISLLLPLTKHLEELGLGRHLDLSSLTQLFVPDENLPVEEQMAWIPHSLRYIDVSDLSIEQLDLGTLFGSSCPILKGVAEPLEVVEVGTEVFKKVEKAQAVKRVGALRRPGEGGGLLGLGLGRWVWIRELESGSGVLVIGV